MPHDRPQRRRHSRSISPVPSKHKRSWQPSSTGGGGGGRGPPRRSLSPVRGNRGGFKPPPKFGGRGRDYPPPQNAHRRSRSPRNHKRNRAKSPLLDRRETPPYLKQPQYPAAGDNDRSGSKFRGHRSPSPGPPPRAGGDRARSDSRFKRSGSPDTGRSGPPAKKKQPLPPPTHYSPPARNRSRSLSPPPPLRGGRSPVTSAPTSSKRVDSTSGRRRDSSPLPLPSSSSSGRHALRGGSIPQRRVSTSEKKKSSRVTLHRRFTPEDQEPFRLEENVTIAILRNPNAEPSEDVTVKRVFDASLFKMVHKKTEGKKPIFDREEIKVWRHDDNLADDPDFERRLVRVKSSAAGGPKHAADSLSRMSPDTIRKAFGLQIGERSRSRSPHREPEIRLDPRPDPRYESKFRQQVEREEGLGKRRKDGDRRSVEDRKAGPDGRRKEEDQFGRKDDGRKSGGRGRGDTYDLRQALEKRRSDREDTGGFRIEVRRGERDSSTELYYRDSEHGRSSNTSRLGPEEGRSVVVDYDRNRGRRGSSERAGGDFRPWDNNRRWPRGRGRGTGGFRGANRGGDWIMDKTGRDWDGNSRGPRGNQNQDRRPRYSASPPSTRGRRGGFRGRGRGRDRDYDTVYDKEAALATAQEIDDSFKYTQHDDRDLSPKMFRGRGGRGRSFSRGFGSTSFRANHGGGRGFRSRGRSNFRGGYRGRGINKFNENWNSGDRRSVERARDPSLEREWKHDMYDSLQDEEEEPHSTTVGT
ncbi:serine/arginine repetitive matrix protein 1 [Aplysia californica]|uniref:Serine/arginine repetitive matrix protein 1 n=1 Tax=Aplysia californica TaxID=6500 RepID=A0ABM1ADI5_APLCA|nr:serine/arginine repetitive matrix protein 1 [Aplysia californica]